MITNQTRATSSRRWVWLVGLVLLVAAAAALGATRWHRGARDSAAGGPPRAIPVTVVAAETQDVPIFLSAPATVQAWNTVAVRSQIDGKLIAVNFAEGQDVREGFALAEIESGALKAAVDQAVRAALAPGRFLVPNSVVLDQPHAAAGGGVAVAVRAKASPVDADRVRRTAAGHQPDTARARLERLYGDGTVRITGRPPVVPWLPVRRARITVAVRPA